MSIAVENEKTYVSVNDRPQQTYRTHVTKIADGIYFISWLDEPISGDHIVFNQNTMKVFDHVTSDAVRGEQIHDVLCFGPRSECTQG